MEKLNAAIVGVGMTDFGKHLDKSIIDLVVESYNDAMADAGGLEHDDIDALIYSSCFPGIENEPTAIHALLNEQLGYADRPAFRVELACSSGAAGLRIAASFVTSGLHDVVMVIGFEKQNVDARQSMMDYARALDTRYDTLTGFCGPGGINLFYKEYMRAFPHCREEDFAAVAAKGHTYAVDHPHAAFGKQMTVEDVMKGPYLVHPLKMFEVTPIVDGATAFIVTKKNLAKTYTNKPPIHLLGTGMAIAPQNLVNIEKAASLNTRVAARRAFDMAGLSPKDIKIAELYDCYTWAEIVSSEEIGFFQRGEGCIAAREGKTAREGVMPVNVLGGNQGRGHPPGATAGAQIHDIVKLMRGEVGKGQPKGNLDIGLIHELGSSLCICAVTILGREE